MDEFLKLILTGERLQKLQRFNLLFRISGFAELLFAMPLLFTATSAVHAAVSIALGIMLIVFGIFNTVLSFRRTGLCNLLVKKQIFTDGLNADGESKARKTLAEKYAELYTGKGDTVIAVLGIIPVGIYLAASTLSVLVNTGVTSSAFIVPVLYVSATVTTIIIAFIPAVKDAKNKTVLYETADEEITLLKKSAGIDESLIAKQSYNARNTATRSQELFLCDPADRAELRRVASLAGRYALALGIVIVAAIVGLGLIGDNLDETFMAVSWSCLMAVVFFTWVAVAIRMDIRRRAIYNRNAAKLTDSETDDMRRYLQNEFVKLQRFGNIFFSLFCGFFSLLGFILGATSALQDPEISFIENVTGVTLAFFIMSAILSLIVWTGFYGAYRKKVKPVEIQLSNMKDD